MYDTILVATDGSGSANRAVTHALDQAEHHDAMLHAIFVVDTERFTEPALSSIELDTIKIEDWGSDLLEKLADRAADLGVNVQTRCCHGKPYREIIRFGDEVDADMIVLGYQGHSHSAANQIGSVTDRVVKHAGRPVLVV